MQCTGLPHSCERTRARGAGRAGAPRLRRTSESRHADSTYVSSAARDHYRQQTVAGGFSVERVSSSSQGPLHAHAGAHACWIALPPFPPPKKHPITLVAQPNSISGPVQPACSPPTPHAAPAGPRLCQHVLQDAPVPVQHLQVRPREGCRVEGGGREERAACSMHWLAIRKHARRHAGIITRAGTHALGALHVHGCALALRRHVQVATRACLSAFPVKECRCWNPTASCARLPTAGSRTRTRCRRSWTAPSTPTRQTLRRMRQTACPSSWLTHTATSTSGEGMLVPAPLAQVLQPLK